MRSIRPIRLHCFRSRMLLAYSTGCFGQPFSNRMWETSGRKTMTAEVSLPALQEEAFSRAQAITKSAESIKTTPKG